ncbi:Gtr1/RagA G protein Gtr2 [Phanerochaete sordida]|uniref:GTP-binding protein n=1 Tax=Phanerochaete sordida TaxID=48140 RepID=A0A9P3GHW6_9APHY|nr:Gtr1/RagA G protein Gtr2 [Phanerochaete sordida]
MASSRSSSHVGLNSSFYGSTAFIPVNGSGALADPVLRTKILLMGMRRSGKTSIQEVLFHALPPKQTFYLEMTTRVSRHTYDTVIPLEIWDCPGTATLDTLEAPLSQFSTLVFVIDIQDFYQQPISKLADSVATAYQENPGMHLEVFVHKADALSDEYKIENFRLIQQRVTDELIDISPEYEQIPIEFHLTSIYDHSLHEAFSRVLHKLTPSLPYLEDLLNVFCANSQASKAFLFDTSSRLYVATDASPVDPPTHSLCSDYLQMLNSFGPLYRSTSASVPRHQQVASSTVTSPAPSEPTSPRPVAHAIPPSAGSTHSPLPPLPEDIPSLNSSQSPTVMSPSVSTVVSPKSGTPTPSTILRMKNLFYPSASASLSPNASGAGTTVTYHLVTPRLALLAVLPTAIFETRRGLVEYNVVFFREGVQEICEVEEEARKVG